MGGGRHGHARPCHVAARLVVVVIVAAACFLALAACASVPQQGEASVSGYGAVSLKLREKRGVRRGGGNGGGTAAATGGAGRRRGVAPSAEQRRLLRGLAWLCKPGHESETKLAVEVAEAMESGRLVLPHKTMYQFSFTDASGATATAVMPMVQHLFTLYTLTGSANVRRVLLAALRAGQPPLLHSAESLGNLRTGEALPPFFSMPSGDMLATVLDFDMRADVELAEALIVDGRYHAGAYYVRRDLDVGVSYLGVLQRSFDYTLGPYFELLHRATRNIIAEKLTRGGTASTNCDGGDGGGGAAVAASAAAVATAASAPNASQLVLQALAAVSVPPDNRRRMWSPPQREYFESLHAHSIAFRRLVARLTDHVLRGEATTASYRADSLAVDDEVTVRMLRWLRCAPGFNVSELLVRCPFTGATVAHLVAAKSASTAFLDEVVAIAREDLGGGGGSCRRFGRGGGGSGSKGGEDGDDGDGRGLEGGGARDGGSVDGGTRDDGAFHALMQRALTSTMEPWGFTPLHVAAIRWGERSEMYRRLVHLDARLASGAAAGARDKFGLLPVDYGARAIAFTDPARNNNNDNNSNKGGGSGGGYDPFKECRATIADFLAMPHALVPPADTAAVAAAATARSARLGGDGGWDRGVRAAVQLNVTLAAALRPTGPGRITEVEGMPTLSELFLYLLQQKPVIFRTVDGADADAHLLGGLRRRWTRGNLLAAHGNVTVDIGEVPFAKRQGIGGARHATLPLRNWVGSWYEDDAAVPRADDDIVAEVAAATAAAAAAAAANPYGTVGKHRKRQKRTGKDTKPPHAAATAAASIDDGHDGRDTEADPSAPMYLFSTRLLEDTRLLADAAPMQTFLASIPGVAIKASQFYLGPAGSGASTHYHQIACNLLAWGEKHWVVSPPATAERSDVPAAAALPGRLAAARAPGTDVVEFVQHAGDLVLLPASWGHSTFNLRPSVGVASQLNFQTVSWADWMEFKAGAFEEAHWRPQKVLEPAAGDSSSGGSSSSSSGSSHSSSSNSNSSRSNSSNNNNNNGGGGGGGGRGGSNTWELSEAGTLRPWQGEERQQRQR